MGAESAFVENRFGDWIDPGDVRHVCNGGDYRILYGLPGLAAIWAHPQHRDAYRIGNYGSLHDYHRDGNDSLH